MNNPIRSFPKILRVGSRYIKNLFDNPVEITEKIDGSQLSFGKKGGVLYARSKNKMLVLDAPDKMFQAGIDFIKSIEDRLPEGIVFHTEYMNKPKHNTIKYDEVPKNNMLCFGVSDGEGYLFADYREYALKAGIECVPILLTGLTNHLLLDSFLNTDSVLGGSKVEGVVIKNYKQGVELGSTFCNVTVGKFVSDKFREQHDVDWRRNSGKGKVEALLESYRTKARWRKGIQQLKEVGPYVGEVQDIGPLIKLIQQDIANEEVDGIKEQLWKIYRGDLMRKAVAGLPEFYKRYLVFGDDMDVIGTAPESSDHWTVDKGAITEWKSKGPGKWEKQDNTKHKEE